MGALIGLTIAGALAGAASHALPSDRFSAEAVIAIQPDTRQRAADAALRWQAAAEVARLPAVIGPAARASRANGDLNEVRTRVAVAGRPGTTVMQIQVRDRSPGSARALADAVAVQTLLYLQKLNRRNLVDPVRLRSYSFETDTDGWAAGESSFSFPPRRVVQDQSIASSGRASLRFDCVGASGCGPGVQISGEFLAGVTYRARALVRSARPGVRIRLILGASASDVAAGETITTNSSTWRLVRVSYTPAQSTSDVELAFQTQSAGTARLFIDAVTMVDTGAGDPTNPDLEAAALETGGRVRAARNAAENRYSIMGPAVSTGEVKPRTALWASGGALLGILIGLAGIAGGELARRRRDQHS